jgi:hypothetical protein
MFHNLSGSPQRWLVLLIPADDLLDPGHAQRLQKFVPRDAKVIGTEVRMGNQIALLVESGEFMPIPHGTAVKVKPLGAT